MASLPQLILEKDQQSVGRRLSKSTIGNMGLIGGESGRKSRPDLEQSWDFWTPLRCAPRFDNSSINNINNIDNIVSWLLRGKISVNRINPASLSGICWRLPYQVHVQSGKHLVVGTPNPVVVWLIFSWANNKRYGTWP